MATTETEAVDPAPESLRERQKRLARESILQAAADEIAERGIGEFSLQDVAARAGVSVRTLYNYFESRDVLLVALSEWSDRMAIERGGARDIPELNELPEKVARMWAIWEEQGSVYTALSQIVSTQSPASSESIELFEAQRSERTEQVRARIDDRWPDLDEATAEELSLWVHAALGPALWERMRRLGDLPADRAGRINAWILHQIIDALDRGERP